MKSLDALLDELGYAGDPECAGTAERFAELLRAYAPGRPMPALDVLVTESHDPVLLRDLPFHSLCAHHLLPFFGTATIAIEPAGRIAGLGAIPRALKAFARRPQLQERLGAQLAAFLGEGLGASVVVHLRARQLCMEMRGVESPGTVETWSRHGDSTRILPLLRG